MRVVVDGAVTHAGSAGRELDPALPLMVFIHGAGLDSTVWQLQTRYFAYHGFSVAALDLPGHGRSEGEPRASIEGYADWLGEFVKALDRPQAHLVGHSMGSLIALEAAARLPNMVESLVLCGPVAAMPVNDALLSAADAGNSRAFDMMTNWGHGRRAQLGGHPTPGLWMVGGTLRLWERSGPGVLATDLHACNNYRNGEAAARALDCPTRLVTGGLDVMARSEATEPLRQSIAGVDEVVIDDAGHIMMIEAPEPVIQAIGEFHRRRIDQPA